MHAKGFAYLIMTEEENFLSLKAIHQKKILLKITEFLQNSFPNDLYQCRKKDKVNKVDIVGYYQKGELAKEDVY